MGHCVERRFSGLRIKRVYGKICVALRQEILAASIGVVTVGGREENQLREILEVVAAGLGDAVDECSQASGMRNWADQGLVFEKRTQEGKQGWCQVQEKVQYTNPHLDMLH